MNVNCFRCQSPDHFAANCPQRTRPSAAPAAAPRQAGAALPRAASEDEHLAAIGSYVAAWQRGEISIEEKRRAISDENRSYHGDGVRKMLTYP